MATADVLTHRQSSSARGCHTPRTQALAHARHNINTFSTPAAYLAGRAHLCVQSFYYAATGPETVSTYMAALHMS